MLDAAKRRFEAPTRYRNFISGCFVEASDGGVIEQESPAHGRVVSYYPASTRADGEAAISSAREIFEAGDWAFAYGGERAQVLRDVARLIRQNVVALALVETLETSQPLDAARGEVMFAAGLWDNAALEGYPEVPLDGFKQSGNGRETGRYGVDGYTELKSNHLQIGHQPERWVVGA